MSIVSKNLERAVYVQLEIFLVDNNILYDYQSGFRISYSTDTCLIHLLDHIKVNNSSGLYTGMTVDHVILCNKLKTMGVDCTDWFLSYLQNRHQIVTVGKVQSDTASVVCGVPQGSILGPLFSSPEPKAHR